VSLDDAEAHLAAQEAQLVDQIADGNIEEPMKQLYRRYAKNLYRFGLHVLGDEGLAEEMVQESFQRLWRSAGRYDAGRGSVGAFLFVIARSAAADIRKRPSSRPLLQAEDFQLPPLPDNADQILDSLILREALDKLSLAHAEVLRLILEESLTQAEIAERLGLAIGTVKSRTFNGMRALRSALGERGIHAA
jgi:RNA polymerase sigma-70 factor, ECF subfamily